MEKLKKLGEQGRKDRQETMEGLGAIVDQIRTFEQINSTVTKMTNNVVKQFKETQELLAVTQDMIEHEMSELAFTTDYLEFVKVRRSRKEF